MMSSRSYIVGVRGRSRASLKGKNAASAASLAAWSVPPTRVAAKSMRTLWWLGVAPGGLIVSPTQMISVTAIVRPVLPLPP